MSRIGKLPIKIPTGVTITVDKESITVKGPKGELMTPYLPEVTVKQEGDELLVVRKDDQFLAKSQHGLQRSLINNAVVGVTTGYEKTLEVNGVGFRVNSSNNELDLSLGFSHPVKYKAKPGITIKTDKMNIMISGIDKQLVGQTAAEIRALKKPEPYKGKGIKYADEIIRRKAGKASN